MEYYKDLLENDFSKKKRFKYAWIFNLILGILMLFVSVHYFREYSLEKEFFHIFGGIVFLLLGISHILRWFNFNAEKLFGKAFIKINNSGFTLKISSFSPEQHIDWQDVKSVFYSAGKFTFLKEDGEKINFPVINLGYNTIQEMKQHVSEHAQLNDITQE